MLELQRHRCPNHTPSTLTKVFGTQVTSNQNFITIILNTSNIFVANNLNLVDPLNVPRFSTTCIAAAVGTATRLATVSTSDSTRTDTTTDVYAPAATTNIAGTISLAFDS